MPANEWGDEVSPPNDWGDAPVPQPDAHPVRTDLDIQSASPDAVDAIPSKTGFDADSPKAVRQREYARRGLDRTLSSIDADDAAAHHADMPQEQAAKAVQDAAITGAPTDPAVEAQQQARKKSDDLRDILKDSPALASWAAQSPAHAAALGPDAAPLSAFEAWLAGPEDQSALGGFERYFEGRQELRAVTPDEANYYKANNLPVPMGLSRRSIGHGLFYESVSKGIQSTLSAFHEGWTDLMELISRHPGPHSDAEKTAANDQAASMAESVKSFQDVNSRVSLLGGDAGFHGWMSKAIEMVPGLAPLAVAPASTLPYLFAQSYGSMRLAGVDKSFAFGGALASSLIGAGLGQKFISGLAMKEATQATQAAAMTATLKMFSAPTIGTLISGVGKHAASGYGMAVGMAVSQDAAAMLDENSRTGRVPDASELAERFGKILRDATVVAPFALLGGWGEYHAQQGRYLAAQSGALELRSLSGVISPTNLAEKNPEVLKSILSHAFDKYSVLRGVVDQRRTLGDLDTASQVASDAGGELAGPLAKAAQQKRGELRAYVSTDVFAKAAAKLGVEPEDLVRKVTQTDGQAFSDAEIMKLPISMKLENFLVDLKDAHDIVIPGTTTDPDSPSLNEVREEDPIQIPNEPLNNAKLQEISVRRTSGFTTSQGSTYAVDENGRTTRTKSFHAGHDPADVGQKEQSATTVYVSPSEAQEIGAHGTLNAEAKARVELTAEGVKLSRMQGVGPDGQPYGNLHERTIAVSKQPKAGKAPVEFWPDGSYHAGNEITSLNGDAVSTDAEIAAAHGNLTKLGFELPPLEPIKPKTGTEPPAPGEPGGPKKPPPPAPAAAGEPNWNALAREYVAGRTLGDLDTNVHSTAANKARRAMDKSLLQAIKGLAGATQKGQAGTEAGVEAARAGQASAAASDAARRMPDQLPKEVKALTKQEVTDWIKDNHPNWQDLSSFQMDALRQGIKAKYKAAQEAAEQAVPGAVKEQVDAAKKDFSASRRGQRKAESAYVQSAAKEVKAGDAMQEYLDQKKIYSLNSAIEKERVKTLAEGTKVTDYVESQDRADTRAKIYKGSQSAGNFYDILMESIGMPQRQKTMDLTDAYGGLLDEGAELTFDPLHIEALSNKPVGLAEMTLDQAKNVKTAVDNLKHFSTESSTQYIDGQRADRAETIANDIASHAMSGVAGPSLHELISTLAPTRVAKAVIGLAGDADRANLYTLLQPWGSWGRAKVLGLLHSETEENRTFEDWHQKGLFDVPKDMKDLGNQDVAWPSQKRTPSSYDIKRRDVWRAVSMMGTEEGLSSFVKSWGMSGPEIHDWIFNDLKLSEPEMDMIHNRWRLNDETGQRVAAAQSNNGGVPIELQKPREITAFGNKYQGGYDPFYWTDNKFPEIEAPDSGDTHGLGSETRHDFTVTRQKTTGEPDIRFDNLRAHYQHVAHWLAFNDWVRDMYHMLRDPDFKQVVQATRGDNWFTRLRDQYNIIKDSHMKMDANASIYTTGLLNAGKRLAGGAVFGFNLTVVAGQSAHLLLATTVKNGIGITDLARGLSGVVSGAEWKWAEDNFDVVRNRNTNFKSQVLENFSDITGSKRSTIDPLLGPGVAVQHYMDTFLSRVIALSKYKQQLPLVGHEAAVDEANLFTDRIMPPTTVMKQSAVVRDRTLGMFQLVRNFPSVITNLNAQDAWDTRTEIASGNATLFQGYTGLIGRRLGQAAALGVGNYIMGHGRNAEERENGAKGFGQAFKRSMLTEGVYGNIVMHELMRNFSPIFMGETFNARNIHLFDTPIGAQADRAIRDLGRIAQGGPSDKAFGALDLAGRTLGVIAPSAVRMGEGVYHILGPKDFQNPGDAASMAIYGPRQDATPLSDIGEAAHAINRRFMQ